jgi:hypothetical protein
MADVEREQVLYGDGAHDVWPDKEAEDEVGTGGRVGPDDVWPETPDPMDHLIDLLEQVRDLLSSAVSPDAAERPGSVVPPTDPGHPKPPPDRSWIEFTKTPWK